METNVSDKFDIPNTMHDFAGSSVEQARRAFEDYLAAAYKAIGTLETSAANVRESVRALGADAIAFAEENMAANFDFTKRMVAARSIEEMVKLQSGFIEKQMATFTRQGEKLAQTVTGTAAKAKPAGN